MLLCSRQRPLVTVRSGSILLKNSPLQFREKNFGHEKAVAVKFLCATSFSMTLVVRRFLKIGYFLTTE